MEQSELLRYTRAKLEALNLRYAIVGSFASGAYGESRFTQDIDIVIDLSIEDYRRFCAAFPNDQFYVSEAAVQEAIHLRRPFNVIHPASGNKIDFLIVGDDPWSQQQLDRRIRETIVADQSGYLAAPEDVIIGKLIYYNEGGSEKHLRDITGILRISGEMVDTDYIDRHARSLGVDHIWVAILQKLAQV